MAKTISELMADTMPKSSNVKGAPRLERTLRNLNKLADGGATPQEIQIYLKSEGYDSKSFANAVDKYNKSQGIVAEFGPVKSALQGLTFGFSDEAEAFIKSAVGQGTYEQNLSALNLAKQEFEAESPGQALTSELVGGLPYLALGGTGAVRGQQMLERFAPMISKIPKPITAIGGATAVGGTSAGITGAGQAEPGMRMAGAQELAPVGAAFGLGGTTAAKTIPKIPFVSQMLDVGKRMAGVPTDFAQRADVKLLQALQRDGVSPADALARLQKIKSSNYKPETIIELGGENTRRLADIVAQYPGASQVARTLVEERTAGQPIRVMQDFKSAFNVNADAVQLADDLIKQRSDLSKPLYQKAYQEGGVIKNDRINELMKLQAFDDAYQRAIRIASYDGIELPKSASDIEKIGGFDLMTLDYIKRGLDDVLYNAKSPTSGIGKTELGKLKERRAEFVRLIDESGPESYKAARLAFAGPTEVLEAIELGSKFSTTDARQLRKTFESLSPAEQEGFKIGVFDFIRTNINKGADGADALRRVWGSPEKRDQIRVFLGEDTFNDLSTQLLREKVIRQTDTGMSRQSATVPRKIQQAEFEGETGVIPQMAEKGIVRGGIDYLLRSATGPGQPTAEALAPTLFSTDLMKQMEALSRLQSLDELLRRQAAQSAGVLGVGGGSAAGLLGE